ncbi:MAG TPA: thioredoxin family protein [Baekduia sp.]|nr:thioredoxin family protein [Baekduia sp.]
MLLPSRSALAALAAVLATAFAAGCGDDDAGSTAQPTAPPQTAKAEDFPSVQGKTLGDLQSSMAEGPVLAPTVSVLDQGSNRYAFALFDRARKQISGAQVAVYVANTDGSDLRGPFVARTESMAVKPQFRSRQTASDPDAPKGIYVADLKLRRRGNVAILALVRLDGRLVTTNAYGAKVGRRKGAGPPEVGERPPAINTPTRADVSGDLSKIDTRIEPLPSMHRADFADVLGRKPVVLVFATPQLCASRVCGPVVDVAYQAQSQAGDGVEFIHMEIYNENRVNKGYRPQVARFRLPSEPWTFVIDRTGRVAERFEGAYSVEELQRAIAKVA